MVGCFEHCKDNSSLSKEFVA